MSTYDFNLITSFANSAPSNEIEPFPDYDRGLGIAFVETDGKPEMKGLNGLFSLLTVSLLALKQRGILTWTTGFEYKQGAFVVESNRLYQAKTDNTGKQPSLSQNEWQVWASVSDISVSTNGNLKKTVASDGGVTLEVPTASDSQRGAVRQATSVEVANRSNVNAYITPINVGQTFDASLSTNGWCRLPNGLILQWGGGQGGNNTEVIFPISFPNACLNISITDREGIASHGYRHDTMTKERFRVSTSAPIFTFSWFAIGY